jgi:hypothetical protein
MSTPLAVRQAIAEVTGSEELAGQILSALHKAGYVCAPIEPTPGMVDAAYWAAYDGTAADVWTEMVKAAMSGK